MARLVSDGRLRAEEIVGGSAIYSATRFALRKVALAISETEDVGINEILFRRTAQVV